MVAGLQVAEKRSRHRRHAARHGAARLGAFEQAHALLEHGDGRIGVARIDEARIVALEARFGGFRVGIDEALRQEHRLGGLGELRTERAAVHELGGGTETLSATGRHGGNLQQKTRPRFLEKHKAGGSHLRPFSELV